MDKKTKLFGMTALTLLLAACGGGGSGSSSSNTPTTPIPPNVPDETISPEEIDEFVPFKNESVLEAIKRLLGGEQSASEIAAKNFNEALAHVTGEVFGDYPLGRTARSVKLFNFGFNALKPTRLNILCAEHIENGSTTTLKLKQDKNSCVINDKTLKAGSSISKNVSGATTTITFNNVRYADNLDFNLKDEYLVSGSIKYTSSGSTLGKVEKYETSNLTFQRITPPSTITNTSSDVYNSESREYIQWKDYSVSINDDFGSGSNGTRTLKSKGTVIGQPYDADFRYTLSFDTGKTPFVMEETALDHYKHLPTSGSVTITHKKGIFGTQSVNTKIVQETAGSLKAAVYFKNSKIDDLLWSEIIGQ